MSFVVYPAIDLIKGKCVRLYQGDYAKETIYSDDPIAQALKFESDGAEWNFAKLLQKTLKYLNYKKPLQKL